jgi:hypothetical protein
MAFVALQNFQTTLSGFLSNVATLMPLPTAAINYINSNLGSGNYTIFQITNGVNTELIQCTGVSGGQAVVVRAQEGTTAYAFSSGSTVRFVWTVLGIQAITNGSMGIPINVTGSGVATVTGGPYAFNVDVPATTLTAGTGISVTGAFPSFTITNTSSGGGTSPTIVTGAGAAAVTPITGGYNVNVPVVSVVAGSGISVTGGPTYTITNTQTPGGTGTVLDVTAGTGISVTGSPTTHPVIGITPTGIAAGTYGGITVNASGQITAVASSIITTLSSLTSSLIVGTPSLGNVTLTQQAATTSAKGIVQLAAPTSTASNNAADSSSAVSPAGINAVVATLAGGQVFGSGSLSPLAAASYTTAIPGLTASFSLAAGKTALVDIFVEVLDTTTPTNIPTFGIGLFNGASLVSGIGLVQGNVRVLKTKLVGPITASLSVSSTTLGGTEAVQSSYITVLTN